MKTFIAAFLSFIALFVPHAGNGNPGINSYAPGNAKKQAVSITASPTPSVTSGPTITATPTVMPNTVTPPTGIRTPTKSLQLVDGVHQFVLTMRRGETIMLTGFSPMKGSEVVSVDLPASGAPSGVFLTQDASVTNRSVFINIGQSATAGTYKWRQKFTAKFTSGTAPGDLSLGVILTILP